MNKYAILLGYFDKQLKLVERLHNELLRQDVGVFEQRYVFALKAQQFYTGIEDLLKQVAKAFENHIEELGSYHKALLQRLSTDIPNIRPALLSKQSFLFLDKLRAFRHFIRHAYDCELDERELRLVVDHITVDYPSLANDIDRFKAYIQSLAK